MKKILLSLAITAMIFAPRAALAHCPLCTVGAGAAAGLAVYLGVSFMSVGVMIGAFAVAVGLWLSRLIKKRFIPGQAWWLALFSYLTTVLPLRMILKNYRSLYLPWWGEYGKTIVIDEYLLGTLIGAIILIASPQLSRWLSRLNRNKTLPYQGIILTFLLLIITAIIIELTI